MNKKLLVTIAFLIPVSLHLCAQEGFQATGGDATGSNGSSSYSVGQLVYKNKIGIKGSDWQGVQQPFDVVAVLGKEVKEIQLDVTAYPNPTVDQLNLRIDFNDLETYSFQMYDLGGKQILHERILTDITQIKMSDYPMATYILNVSRSQEIIKSFKIIKR